VVQSDLVHEQLPRVHPQQLRKLALQADVDVAEADRSVARVEQRAGHDPHRVREVDDPRVGRRMLADLLRDLEHDRHRPQRLGEPPRARRLLTDAAELERDRLVEQPLGLASDPDLDDDGICALHRPREVIGLEQLPRKALSLEHPPRQSADDLEPLGVDVVEREPLHRQPLEA
jgi:hypothetical protein